MSERTRSYFRSVEPAGRLERPAGFAMLVAVCAAAVPAAVNAQPAVQAVAAGTSAFSTSRDEQARPAWFAYGDARAAEQLILLLRSAELDGLDPDRFDPDRLERATQAAAQGRWRDVETAEQMLDEALVRYVAALRRNPSAEWVVVDRAAAPSTPSRSKILADAAGALFLDRYIERLGFMHPSYGELRRALGTAQESGDHKAAELIRLNLKRARFLPGSSGGRYVLVNTAAQRLYMYEDGREVDSMKVVVGKPEQPTPMMAGMIRFTAVNPYWNLPVDLVAERVAPHVLKDPSYLQEKGYVVLSDFTDDATPISASDIDWQAVADGTVKLRMRQEPGPNNAMGRMKFMFPNPQGVYLHDTPDRDLLAEEARLFSAGCVRLEDAPRLAKWLYGKPLDTEGATPEQHVELEEPVPVYLAYLTAVPNGGGEITFHDDIYGRDAAQLAVSDRDRLARR